MEPDVSLRQSATDRSIGGLGKGEDLILGNYPQLNRRALDVKTPLSRPFLLLDWTLQDEDTVLRIFPVHF
jgi:hypothetical protein